MQNRPAREPSPRRRQVLAAGLSTATGLAVATASYQALRPADTAPDGVGFEEIDGQHDIIAGFVADLEHALLGDTDPTRPLAELTRYVSVHFAFEEALMDTYAISGAADHKRRHGQLLAELGRAEKAVRDRTTSLPPGFVDGLRRWLEIHIVRSDVPMAAELAAKGVRSAV